MSWLRVSGYLKRVATSGPSCKATRLRLGMSNPLLSLSALRSNRINISATYHLRAPELGLQACKRRCTVSAIGQCSVPKLCLLVAGLDKQNKQAMLFSLALNTVVFHSSAFVSGIDRLTRCSKAGNLLFSDTGPGAVLSNLAPTPLLRSNHEC
ncbi:hypothetical protein K402DRAFT_23480 [Aulographum hederae CBS 113979]|uniref:Uncharacterized protein n=1 Tax=Aulographum hederae CBS 113979 TaxID=1176131 RepID=A0A6G1H5B0_9PEZI|nr:hypothetical protein K402DRAFT_23480 [Aulographum hederae CBS 113979]